MKRAFVLGLDGACWPALEIYFRQNWMPHLESIVHSSCRGILSSTFPAITPTAWASLISGRDPGSHGIFGFQQKKRGDLEGIKTAVNRLHIQTPTVFDIAAHHRLPLVSINVPMTFPAPEVDGFVICGLLTPEGSPHWIHPPEEELELKKLGIRYAIDMKLHHRGERSKKDFARSLDEIRIKGFFQELSQIEFERSKAVLYAMKKDWRFFLLNFIGLDRLQHFFWDQIQSMAGKESKNALNPVFASGLSHYLKTLDLAIGAITRNLGDHDLLVICSDHGFGECKGEFYLNRWLSKIGELHIRDSKRRLGSLQKWIKNWDLGTKTRTAMAALWKQSSVDRFLSEHLFDIEWKKTRAFFACPYGIRINLRGREKHGILPPQEYETALELLRRQLLNLHDPSGVKVIHSAFRQRDLFSHAEDVPSAGPDLLFAFNDDTYYGCYSESVEEKSEFGERDYKTGDHRRDGILVLSGPRINVHQKNLEAHITDVLPTVLHFLDLPPDSRFEGRILSEAFDRPVEKKKEYRYSSVFGGRKNSGAQGEAKRLKDLGYID